MNDQAITYLKGIQNSLDQLKAATNLLERVAASMERLEELRSIGNLLERIAATNERIAGSMENTEKMFRQSLDMYSKLSSAPGRNR